ncbi:MAG: Asp-tRNA(Asn)/Glu-tRNA(Gln) amidotransferase subunit GatA [Candidatus Cloacimonetes bacterium]|nr:Asp-tRNA(Asn)/Glu-tRNA(Gln) amidotransferase subunit GatA [Candidatus Cloacimonadota bacterium]
MQANRLTISEIQAGLKGKTLTCESLARQYLDAIQKHNPDINAFLSIDPDQVILDAKASDQRLNSGGAMRELEGVFAGIKDNIHVHGMTTTCASKILKGFSPVYEATVVKRLREAGAIIMGKLNCDEFAMGSSNENSAYGPVKNPLNRNLVPGGSSGGSAAAVAAGFCTVALGSDTGGSIRQPASFCSVVGLKPTYGTVSRRGLVAFASSFDQIGPLALCVEDAMLVHQVISGKDNQDATSLTHTPKWTPLKKDTGSLADLVVGVPEEFMGEGIDKEVSEAMDQTIQNLKKMGARVVSVSLKLVNRCLPVYYILSSAEASSNLARYDSVRYGPRLHEGGNLDDLYLKNRSLGFGAEVKRRIILGTYVLSEGYYDAFYLKAQKMRTLIRQDFDHAFTQCDVLLTPTSPFPPFSLGAKTEDPMAMYLADICTVPVSIAGLPAISIPVPRTTNQLPVGIQLITPALKEDQLFTYAQAMEVMLKGNHL